MTELGDKKFLCLSLLSLFQFNHNPVQAIEKIQF